MINHLNQWVRAHQPLLWALGILWAVLTAGAALVEETTIARQQHAILLQHDALRALQVDTLRSVVEQQGVIARQEMRTYIEIVKGLGRLSCRREPIGSQDAGIPCGALSIPLSR